MRKTSQTANVNHLSAQPGRSGLLSTMATDIRRNGALYLVALPGILYYIIFHYIPMYGVIIAFKDYYGNLGIMGSEWVGLKHFQNFFGSIYAARVIKNTIVLNLYSLIFTFPVPIVLALLINEVRQKAIKKAVQSITYLPHFISMVVICGMIVDFVSPTGFITSILSQLGLVPQTNLLYEKEFYRAIYIISDIWQTAGWSSIVYMAALSGLDMELYEAAAVDGAKKMRQMWHITLPGIAPTIVIMLILKIGSMMSLGADKTILLYDPVNYEVSDIISSFIYRAGLLQSDQSYSAAVGLFNSAINCVLVYGANRVSRMVSDMSLF